MAVTTTTTTTGVYGSWGQFGMMALANGISALGSFGITSAKNSIAQSQANIARINAQTMMRQYEATLRASEKDIQKITMKAGQTKGSQRAALAANGIAIGEGSAAEQVASTDIVKEIDVNQTKSNAVREAWGYRMKAAEYEGQALMAEASKQSKGLVALTTLLGASQYSAANYMQMGLAAYGAGQTSSGSGTTSAWKNFPASLSYGYSPTSGDVWNPNSRAGINTFYAGS